MLTCLTKSVFGLLNFDPEILLNLVSPGVGACSSCMQFCTVLIYVSLFLLFLLSHACAKNCSRYLLLKLDLGIVCQQEWRKERTGSRIRLPLLEWLGREINTDTHFLLQLECDKEMASTPECLLTTEGFRHYWKKRTSVSTEENGVARS